MSQWIKLTDHYPPKNVGVLVTDGEDIVCASYDGMPIPTPNENSSHAKATCRMYRRLAWDLWNVGGEEYESMIEMADITHWMPFPALPSEET